MNKVICSFPLFCSVCLLALLVVTWVTTAAYAAQLSTFHFTDPDNRYADEYGTVVSISSDGSTILIGAPNAVTNGNNVGKAYIYAHVNGAWSDAPVITFNDPRVQEGDGFGAGIALSVDGSTALIAAPAVKGFSGTNYARVYVFTRLNGMWSAVPTMTFTNPNGDDLDCFGCAVALSADGQTALIGAPSTVINGKSYAGEVYIFKQANGIWSAMPVAALIDPGGMQDDFFGDEAALSGDGTVALVGSNQNIGLAKAFVFISTNDNWPSEPTVTFNDPIATNGDWFGSSVALSDTGNIALIADRHVNNGAGVVYVFAGGKNNWSTVPVAVFPDPLATAGDDFGAGVALSGDGRTALIGAPGTAGATGEAYVYKQTNGLWSTLPVASLVDPVAHMGIYDQFGASVGLSSTGDSALIGVPQTPGLSPPPPMQIPTGGGSGEAYAYESPNGWSNPPPPSGGGKAGGGGSFGWLSLAALFGILLLRKGASRAHCS